VILGEARERGIENCLAVEIRIEERVLERSGIERSEDTGRVRRFEGRDK